MSTVAAMPRHLNPVTALAHARPKKWFKRANVSTDTRPHSAICLVPEEPRPEVQLPLGQAGVLFGRSAAERATFKLSRFSVVKKAYEPTNMQCKICDKRATQTVSAHRRERTPTPLSGQTSRTPSSRCPERT